MAVKKIKTVIKLQIQAGKANPAPPVGPALGQHGLNIQDFCMQFNEASKERMGDVVPVEITVYEDLNEASKERMGDVVPVEITVYEDRTFSFEMKTSPASELLKKAAGAQKGASNPVTDKVGKVTKAQVREIAELKMVDLNAASVEAAMKIIEGTARSMGITVEE